jgi:gliding motility-associated lipoprotein GldJ
VAYNNYPVVGVTWEQATDYATWRTDRVNEMALAQSGATMLPDFEGIRDNEDHEEIRNNQVFNTQKYMLSSAYNPEIGEKPKQDLFGNDRKVTNSDGILFPDFRLPTESEWEYAAYAIHAIDGEENSGEGRQFPWTGHQMRNPSKKYRGEMQANYARGRGDYMGMGGRLNDRATVTNTVDSYWPNDFGLYNMAGNVNEWVMDVYRPLTGTEAEEYNAFRGNEWKSVDWENSTATGEEVKIPVIDSLGRVTYVYPSVDTALIHADVRNYGDGDARSGMNADNWKLPIDPAVATGMLYNADNDLLAVKLTNRTRVYKGGSWRDRPYWLNPSARRYLEQDQCRDDIGFRCVVSKVGSDDTRFR